MAREALIERNTKETQIRLQLNIDGTGSSDVDTGIGFFDHMLDGFTRHGLYDLTLRVHGDLNVDDHHTIEDVGILLGEAFNQAIGDKRGIKRMADATVPMDESVAKVAVDIGGRSYCNMEFDFTNEKIGDMTSEIVIHFFESFASSAKLNIYGVSKGANDHHQAEAVFKAFAKALKEAIKIEHDEIPSTKGVL